MRIEGAPQLSIHSENREVIRRDMFVAQTLGLCAAGQVHVCANAGDRNRLKDPGIFQVSPLRYGGADVVRAYAGKIVLNPHQFGRPWVRQRMQQCRVDHAVDRGGGSNAQRHGSDRNQRESRRSEQHASCIPQVLQQRLNQLQLQLGVVFFPDCPDRSKLEHSLAARFRSRHASADIVRRLLRQMFLHLFLQALIGAAAGCKVRQTRNKTAQESS